MKLKERIDLLKNAGTYKRCFEQVHDEYFYYREAVMSMLRDGLLTVEQVNEIERRAKIMNEG